MSKKFTEEQYQRIIEEWGSAFGYEQKTTNVVKLVSMMITRDDNTQYFEALALANPSTREWAHDKFVEKDKKYYWSTKKKGKKGKPMTLFKSAGGIAQMIGTKHALTESEVKAWGYNPEMFDKEEVD